ncbi:structural maintenance of chromosomes protein 5 [Achlya hypogyna]|uniref:Structural maintenance of chromosomes protein 5 n=1 Tax=Achlya hypogyna TaxID=1202772 RepID=A0A1V9YH78_ACHHY|nr:structural maintenance of chromosomes protein 5 [Achlya hypogyna]
MDESSNDEYMEGSIYRVRLHNFLTYTDAELFPGPRLNVVLGPNGTGKSSIVCALCVGLAGSTKILGRADKVGQFVKHEQESGFTEIELYFAKGNVSIRRTIYRDNRSTWQLNGRDVGQNKVKEVLSRAAIQIDNLCQFLPQDKVGEFSRMTPIQLLKATQAAIDNGELAEQQEEIITIQRESSSSVRDLDRARATLELKKTENLQRQTEVERIREHEQRRNETNNMKKKLKWLVFEECKREVQKLISQKMILRTQLKAAKEQQLTPLQTMLNEQTEAGNAARAEKRAAAERKVTLEKKLDNLKLQMDALDREASQTKMDLREVHGRHAQMQAKLERMTRDVEASNERLTAMPSEDDLRNQKNAEMRLQRDADRREYGQLEHDIRRLDAHLAKLNNEHQQRKAQLAREDRDCMRAYDWVQANGARLRRKVWGPLALELQVKDPLHAKCLEDTLQKWQLTCFVTECKEDSDLMIRELNEGNQRIGVSVINIQNGECSRIERPYTPDQLGELRAKYGMDRYLDEVVTAPDVIHEVLRSYGGIHTVLLATDETERMINEGHDIFTPISHMNKKAAFCTPAKKYVATVSKYGNQATTTRTNDIRPCRLLGVSSANEELKEQLHTKRAELVQQIERVKAKIDAVQSQEREFSARKHAVTHQVQEIRDQLRARNKLVGDIESGRLKIRQYEAELAKDYSDKIEGYERKLKNLLTKHVKLLQGSHEAATALVDATTLEAELTLQSQTAEKRQEIISRTLRNEAAKLEQLKAQYEAANQAVRSAGERAQQLKRDAERAAPWDEYEAVFEALPDDMMELRARIDNNEAAQEHFRGDMRIVEVYERVRQEIAAEEEALAQMETNMATLTERIDAIRIPWLEKLTAVVTEINAKFKHYFQEIGCVGEVYLNQDDDDIAKWGIERRAQFRVNAKLTRMTAEEQSGGEKSVGTIMYLMALQSLTKCPFRVVDEINQGMDIHNERKVFKRITRSSCGGKLPQYFLITPKLITGLEYHRDTKVLFILNGAYNIRQNEWNVDDILKQRPIKRQRAA